MTVFNKTDGQGVRVSLVCYRFKDGIMSETVIGEFKKQESAYDFFHKVLKGVKK